MPLFGLIPDIKNYEIKRLLESDIVVYLSSISLLEIKYLLIHEFKKTKEKSTLNRYETILPTITNHKSINIVNGLMEPMIHEYANNLYYDGHSDLFDCIVIGTAMHLETDILSEDTKFTKISPRKVWNWKTFNSEY
jgi:PIN domain nuclease of toxin-antitoxin system